jgi:hypothetical protein
MIGGTIGGIKIGLKIVGPIDANAMQTDSKLAISTPTIVATNKDFRVFM